MMLLSTSILALSPAAADERLSEMMGGKAYRLITHSCQQSQNLSESLPLQLCKCIHKLYSTLSSFTDFLLKISLTARELKAEREDLESIISQRDKICRCPESLRCRIWLGQHFINIFLGIVFMIPFFLYGSFISAQLLVRTELVVKEMVALLDWLMGVPAGLKLNSKLTIFLGKFFMYHIWLWAEYLRLAAQYFDIILKVIGGFGLVGGASLQLAMIQDTINIFVLHIYCFYIYSARLFSLANYSLLSLWRLFRGLKWNTLRKRVDHASYNGTQLFVGTLLFSILLFLLPTIFLYYIVFASMRIVALLFHAALNAMRSIVARTYLLIYALRYINTPYLADDYNSSKKIASKDDVIGASILHLPVTSYQTTCEVLGLPHGHSWDTQQQGSLSKLLKSLVSGEIV